MLNAIGQNVARAGTTISSPGFAVDVRNGCNGVEAAIILIAAILATPARWKAKAVGVVGGFVLLEAINLVRISSLYLLGAITIASSSTSFTRRSGRCSSSW